jgi:uncharacterized protein with HEPN domain
MKSKDINKLDHINKYCIEIGISMNRFGKTFNEFNTNTDYQRSIAFCIMQIGELADRLSKEFINQTIDYLPWKQINGMKNRLIQGYLTIEISTLWNIVLNDIQILHSFCTEILKNKQT